jgi:electron transport complex protein RnfD
MRDVTFALIPATVFGIINIFMHSASAGINSLLTVIVSIASAVAAEYVWEKCMKKPITTGDWSAVVTGLLIGMNMPPRIPLYMPILGSVFAIIIVKQLFGGIGQNFMNPALAARCFLLLSFGSYMNNFLIDGVTVDGISSATPLAILKGTAEGAYPTIGKLFLGNVGGTIGETSALFLILGGLYLIYRKVISWKIPVIYIAVFAVFMLIFGGHGFGLNFVLCEVFGGGLMLGAWFMAADYVSSPITPNGQIVYAVILGCLTGIFRVFGNSAEGVSFAIIFTNILVPIIEMYTMPKAFGREGEKK